MAHPGGRPLKFQSVEELDEKIKLFFDNCDANDEPYTITGLALALDTNRETLVVYQDKPEFSDTINKAKLRCEVWVETNLMKNKVNPVGAIFTLKNNYGWKDRTETDVTTKGESLNGKEAPEELERIIAESQSLDR